MTRPRSRGNGEGTIIERADGRIVVRLFVDGHRIERTARTKADGKVLLKAMLDRKAAGLALDADRLSVGAYLLQWLETARPNVRPKTWERYEQIVRLDATRALGHVPLMKLGPHHLQGLYARRLDAGRSPTTVHHLHRVLHRALRQAERWGLVGRNPVALVDAPRRAKPEMRALVPEEAQRLLDAADGDRLEALFVLAITTGMRQGELFGLRWADVDLDAATLSVRQAVQWLKGGPVCTQPKTARSRRSISLTRRAIAALRQHRVRQAEERLKIGQAWRDGGPSVHEYRRRAAGAAQRSAALVPTSVSARGPAPRSLPRHAAHGSYDPARSGRTPEARQRDAGVSQHLADARHLLPCNTDHARCGSRCDGCCAR